MSRVPMFAAFGFGVVFLGALLVLAVTIPHPTEQQFEIFRIVLAVAVAGAAAMIPGMLDIRLRKGRGMVLTASGALAVFVVVYFYSPAHWVTAATAAINPQAIFQNNGQNYGQQINGSHNIYNGTPQGPN